MVLGVVAAVAIIVKAGEKNKKDIAPICNAAVAIGGVAGSTAATIGTGSAVATGVGVGTSAGAITGAGMAAAGGGTGAGAIISSAFVGGLTGGTSAAGVGGTGAGLGALVAGTGGLGLLAVGTSVNHENDEVTYDCSKPVVHDTSQERSNGMLLKDMVAHPCVYKVTIATGICDDLPNIIIENIWNERFEIEYVLIRNSGKIACHAKPLQE